MLGPLIHPTLPHKLLLDDLRDPLGCWSQPLFCPPIPSPSPTEASIISLNTNLDHATILCKILQSTPQLPDPWSEPVVLPRWPGCLSCHYPPPTTLSPSPQLMRSQFQPQESRSCPKYPEALPTLLFLVGLPTPPLFCLTHSEDDFKSESRFHLFSGILPEFPF